MAEDMEALAWFQRDPPPLGLDVHKERRPVAEAIRYIRGLYALGAVLVTVPAWAMATQQATAWRKGGEWARGLEVTLPESGPEREALIWYCAGELKPTFQDPDMAAEHVRSLVGSRKVVLCWP
jgi:hypothetical protein